MPCQVELNTFDKKLLNYIYNYPGQSVKTIQTDFNARYIVSSSLRKLHSMGLISENSFRWYPVCNQVSL